MDVLAELRAAEGCDPEAWLLWDTQWTPGRGYADWAIAGADETENRGGLQAVSAIETAVILSLFTDRAVPAGHPLRFLADGQRGGWWGDGVDVREDEFEAPLGSLLWLLERAPLTIAGRPITVWAETFAVEALEPLRAQGVVSSIAARAEAFAVENRLDLQIDIVAPGAQAYQRRFALLWRQVAAMT